MNGTIIETDYFSVYTNKEHHIRIYLPGTYECDASFNYPVLYMTDGQNVFSGGYSGISWGVAHYLDSINGGLIVVAIDNNGLSRYEEYSPWVNELPKSNFENRIYGGQGDAFAMFVCLELKPYIDKFYRTLTDRAHTAIAGSSMGAFISSYIAFKYSSVYGNLGCFSIASWFAEKAFLSYVSSSILCKDNLYYLYVGEKETSDPANSIMSTWYINNSNNLYQLLSQKDIFESRLIYNINSNGEHNELCWSEAVKPFLKLLIR